MTTFNPGHGAVLDDGVHGIVERNWDQDGTTGLVRRVMTQDGANAYTAAVVGRELQFSGTAAGAQQRESWQLPYTTSPNSEMTSLLRPSTTLGASDAQWGHIHREVFDPAAGLMRAFAVWTDTTIPIPTLLNYGAISYAGGAMSINNAGNNPVPDALTMLRELPVLRAQRTGNVVTCWTSSPWLPSVGDTGTLSGMAAAGFNAAAVAVTAVDRNRRTFSFAQVAADATDADAGGVWAPATRSATIPYYLSTRLVGNTLYSKMWHQEEPEPDWGNAGRIHSVTVAGGPPAPHSGPGACSFWVAHLASPNVLRFGGTRWRKLA